MLKTNPIRTKSQLNFLFKKMVEIKNKCEENNINYRLGGGSLLGICRTGELLPWATGATFHFLESEFKKFEEVFKEINFFDRSGGINRKGKFLFKGFVFEFILWYPGNNFVIRKKYKLPIEIFEGDYFIEFKNEKFKTFNTPIKYLEFRYGPDWRTPINSNIRKNFKEQDQYHR